MGFREALSLPPDCSLNKEFPDGKIYVQMSGVESYEGPAHVTLYDQPWEQVPRMPVMHLQAPMGTSADHEIRMALGMEHNDTLTDSECGCIALDSLGVIARLHREAAAV